MSTRETVFAGLRMMTAVAQEQLHVAEVFALGVLKRRMELAAEAAADPVPPPARPATAETAATLLRALLEKSMDQSREDTREALFDRLVRALLPDEARILAALSDGTTYPLVHVEAGPRLGSANRRVLANLSSVGKSAGVACPEMTPVYVSRLMSLGLADTGPEDEAHEVKYEILATDEVVRQAIERIRKEKQKETVLRRVLVISDLGRTLWAACGLLEDQP